MKFRASCVWLLTSTIWVSLRGEGSDIGEELGFNSTTLKELLKLQANPFLQDLQGHWSFNDTNDISKYEEFDHTRFQGSREPSLEELLEKARFLQIMRRRRPDPPGRRPTPSPRPSEPLPTFDLEVQTNVTAQLGSTAFLHCRVLDLGNRAVSWVRKRDWHILTSAMLTYTNDERFQVLHAEGSDDWTLQIKYVQKRDNGAYECQVGTGSGTMAQMFELEVAVPTAHILGTEEYHIGHGSSISLLCIIQNSRLLPQFVMWYHNDQMMNYEDGRESAGSQNVRVETETRGDQTHSRLLITEATPRQSGNYTCKASNTEPDSVYVFVSTDGDNIAAIQRHNSSVSMRSSVFCILLTLVRYIFS